MPFDLPPSPPRFEQVDVTIVSSDAVVSGALLARVSGHAGWTVRARTSFDPTAPAQPEIGVARRAVAVLDLGPVADDVVVRLADARLDLAPTIVLMPSFRHVGDALGAGARGVLSRDVPAERLTHAILAVACNLIVIDPAASAAIVRPRRRSDSSHEALTAREVDVVQALSEGLTNRAAAERLGISEHTVKFHVGGVMSKLAVRTRTEAVVEAARRGLVVL